MANSKRDLFLKRRMRVRNKLKKTARGKLRMSVHRSNKNISVQIIDDVQGVTLAAASSLEQGLGVVGKNNVEAAAKIGTAIAERARAKDIEEVCNKLKGRVSMHVVSAADYRKVNAVTIGLVVKVNGEVVGSFDAVALQRGSVFGFLLADTDGLDAGMVRAETR